MQIYCTKKLLSEARISPSTTTVTTSPIFSWSANIITCNRRKAVVCVNDFSRFGFVLYGLKAKQLKSFPDILINEIRNCLLSYCVKPEIVERFIYESPGIHIANSASRSLISRLNTAVQTVEFYAESLNPNNIEQPFVNRRLNVDLVGDGNGGYYHPVEKLAEGLLGLYGDSLFSCKAADLTIKLNLNRYTAWRRVIVPLLYTFEQLHSVIQASFFWEDMHMYEYELKTAKKEIVRLVIDHNEEYDLPDRIQRHMVRDMTLADFIPDCIDLTYTYDFGDNWIHEIHLNGINDNFSNYHPVCLMGEGNAPPEDVGGVGGYLDFLDAINSPDHPDHENMVRWIAGQWYKDFNISLINHRLNSL